MQLTPDPDQLAGLTARIEELAEGKPGIVADAATSAFILGQFTGMLQDAAHDHGLRCAGCEYCAFITRGLTLVAALQIQKPELGQATWRDHNG